jgi:hypothetical protein
MKRFIILLLTTLILENVAWSQVSISTDNTSPDPSAMLDIQSTDKGILIPRMTTAQRNLISAPAAGLLVFDTVAGGFWFYNGSEWQDLSGGDKDKIADADNDTRITVEENTDEDRIRFTAGGTQALVIQKNANGDIDLIGSMNNNVLIGSPHDSSTGDYNTMLGANVAKDNTTGNKNTFVGSHVGRRNIDGSHNVFIGTAAGFENTAGSGNVIIGYSAGYDNQGDNNVFIGFASASTENVSNRLFISNNSVDSAHVLIYGEFDNHLLAVNGTLRINDGTQGAGKVLICDADGNASWEKKSFYNKITDTSAYPNDDDWQDVTDPINISNWNIGDLLKLEGNLTLRLASGSGVDAFNIRVKLSYGLCGQEYSNLIAFSPDETSADHDNFTIVPYLDVVELNSCNAGSLTCTLQVQNTGDDPWEVRDRTLIVTKL